MLRGDALGWMVRIDVFLFTCCTIQFSNLVLAASPDGIEQGMRALLGEYSQTQVDSMCNMMAQQYANLAVGFAAQGRQRGVAKKAATPVVAPPPPPPETQDKVDESDEFSDEFSRVFHHNITNARSPQSVSSIHQEYYGEGRFKDIPVVGGLKGLEDKYGTKWRVGGAFQKAFNRLQLIVKCVDSQIQSGKAKEVVLTEMDKLFDEKNCRTLQSFRNVLEKEELLPKMKQPKKKQRSTGTTRPAELV
jgi:hypothetical protein